MTKYLSKTSELNSSNYIRIPESSSSILNRKNDDKLWFLWSNLAHLHHCEKSHFYVVSNYTEFFSEFYIVGFEFSYGIKFIDVNTYGKLNNLSKNIIELSFYQKTKEVRHKLFPVEISKNDLHKVSHIIIYTLHDVLTTELHVVLGEKKSKFVCRRFLKPSLHQKILVKHKRMCEQQKTTANKTSNESNLYCTCYFYKNIIYFRVYADFEANNEIDNSHTRN